MSMTKAVDAICLKFELVDGAATSTNIAVSGITTSDTLVMVLEQADSTALPTDRTATTSITSAGNIQCTATTENDKLLVLWHDASA